MTALVNLVGERGSVVGGIVSLDGTRAVGHRTFAQAVADGDGTPPLTDGATVFVLVSDESNNNMVWEAVYDHTAQALNRTREVTATGSAIPDTSTVHAYVVADTAVAAGGIPEPPSDDNPKLRVTTSAGASSWVDSGDAALKDTGQTAGDVAPGDIVVLHEGKADPHPQYAPVGHVTDTSNPHAVTAVQVNADPAGSAAGAVAQHEVDYVHSRIPDAGQKDALDNANPPLSSSNYVAGINNVVTEGDALNSTGEPLGRVLVTDGADGFVYEDKGGGAGTDELVGVTASDTTPGYLYPKFTSGDGSVSLAVLNPGGDEQIDIRSLGGVGGVPEAPTDGGHYRRRNATWEADPIEGDALSDGELYGRRDGAWSVVPVSPIGAVWTAYTWSDDIAPTSPGVGGIKVNSSNHTLATALYVHSTTGGGNNADHVWGSLQAGDYLGIYEDGSDREGIYYTVTAPPVDETGWWTIPIAVVPGSVGGMENLQPVQAFTIRDPRNRNPVGGTAGQVLAKIDAVDHNTAWVTLSAADVGADPAGSAAAVQVSLDTHVGDATNPHSVTKTQVGLGNADNTSDLDKPISTATQAALDGKEPTISPKNSAFNRPFSGPGVADTVARSDHDHSGTYLTAVVDDTDPYVGGDLKVGGANGYVVSLTDVLNVEKGSLGWADAAYTGAYLAHSPLGQFDPNDGAVLCAPGKVTVFGAEAVLNGLQHTDPAGYQDLKITENGVVFSAPPPDPGWQESATSTFVYDFGIDKTTGPWQLVTGLSIDPVNDVAPGERLDLTVILETENTEDKQGTLEVGFGINGATPTGSALSKSISPDSQVAVVFSFSTTTHGGLSGTDTVDIWARRGASQDDAHLYLRGDLDEHEFLLSVPGAGGGVGGDPTNLTTQYGPTSVVIESSTGSNATIVQAVPNGDAGVLSGTDKQKLDSVEAGAQANVPTNLIAVPAPTTVDITSSTGSPATIPAAVPSGDAGVLSGADKQKLDGIAAGAEVNTVDDVSGANSVQVSPTTGSPVASLVGDAAAPGNDRFYGTDGAGAKGFHVPPVFTNTDAGYAPASGGGTSNFLRADGAWAAPPGGGGGAGDAVVWDVTQAGHPFTQVGQPIYSADGVNWSAAAANAVATLHVAVTAEIVGVNDFKAQLSGILTGIDYATLTPGAYYYLADNGTLSTTPGTYDAPVLFALSASSALILPYRAGQSGNGLGPDVHIDGYTEAGVTTLPGTGTVDVPIDGRVYEITQTGDITLAFGAKPTSPKVSSSVVMIKPNGTNSLAFPASTFWAGGAEVAIGASGEISRYVMSVSPTGDQIMDGETLSTP